MKDPRYFKEVSKTESGPVSYYLAKKSSEEGALKSSHKSFNNAFCYEFFANKLIRESYHYYTQLLFSDFHVELLNATFNISCCFMGDHSVDCINNWVEMKQFIQNNIIGQLGHSVYEPSEDSEEIHYDEEVPF